MSKPDITDEPSATVFFRATRLHADGFPGEAADTFRTLLETSPTHVAGWRGLAGALDALGQEADADDARARADRLEADGIADIGASLLFHGENARARSCFDRALALNPDNLKALWLLAELHVREGDREAALSRYRRCRGLAPTRPGPAYMMAALGDGDTPPRAPADYVAGFFDWYAEHFDEHLVQRLEYSGPQAVAHALSQALGRPPRHLLDLGCGTGLAVQALDPQPHLATGIDLSSAMLTRASARGLYDTLLEGDLVERMSELSAASADAVIAADTLVYVGDVSEVFDQVARILEPGGVFVATFEALSDGMPGASGGPDRGWVLAASGRFLHSPGVLRRTAQAAGLTVTRLDNVSVRVEMGLPVPGLLGVFRKPTSPAA